MRNNPTTFRAVRPGRDRLEPAAGGLRGEQEDLDGRPAARGRRRRRARARRPRHGDALEHTLLGWLEGYLLTGRHGFFHTYEAFAHVDRLDVQPAREVAGHLARTTCRGARRWRRRTSCCRRRSGGRITTASRTRIPGFIDLVTNKGPSVTRIYLPPDANTLLAVADHCLRSTDCINVIVADKQKHLQFTTIDEAVVHCAKGHRHLGAGQHRRRRGAGRRAGVAAATSRRWRRWRRPRSCASACPT